MAPAWGVQRRWRWCLSATVKSSRSVSNPLGFKFVAVGGVRNLIRQQLYKMLEVGGGSGVMLYQAGAGNRGLGLLEVPVNSDD